MNTKKPEKKKINMKQLRKAGKGAIAIFLCIILAPFLTISLGLVEYARYQQVVSLADEFYELTGISLLADYDTYIHDRFGLLATSQEGALSDNLDAYFTANHSVLAGNGTATNASVRGITSLKDTEALRQQVVDFSELTVTTSILAEDFNLDELLAKLEGLEKFKDITNTVSGLAEATDHLSTALTEFKNLQTHLTSLNSLIANAKKKGEQLAKEMSDLYNKLGENGITLPKNASASQIEEAVTAFTDGYVQDFKNLYKTANELVSQLSSIKGKLTEIKTSAKNVVDAVKKAKTAMENLNTSNGADPEGEISEAAKSALDEIMDEMSKIVDETLKDLEETLIDEAKKLLDEITKTTLEETGLADLVTRYSEIVNGDYFNTPLTETATQDIVDLLKLVHSMYKDTTGSSSNSEAMLKFLKKKFVPNLNFDVDELLKKVKGIIADAEEALMEKAQDGLWDMLSRLVNIVKSMFDLSVFYDDDLSAFVNVGSNQSGGYSSFLTALGDLFQGIEDFGKSLGNLDIFGLLEALGTMLTAIWDMMKAIGEIIWNVLQSLGELGENLLTGNVRGLYEKLMISGYMTHNLPNRTDSGGLSYDKDGNVVTLGLDGSGLTGFAYDDIARPALYSGQNASLKGTKETSKIQELVQFIKDLQKGHGKDTMFMGAELEYVRAGTNSEIVNQTICFMDLYFLRMLLDLPSVFTDVEVTEMAAAANVAAWVVYILYIVVEPFMDTILLVNGAEIAVLRSGCWLTASGLPDFITKFLEVTISNSKLRGEIEGGLQTEMESFTDKYGGSKHSKSPEIMPLSYDSYMLLILFIYVDSTKQIDRLQDLIKLETAQYYDNNGKDFSMNKTYTSIEVSADLTINTMIDLGALTGGNSIIPETRLKQVISY